MKFVIMLRSPSNKVQLIGNTDGSGFSSEEVANKWAKKYSEKYPRMGVLVLPITALSINTVPL